MLDQEHKLKILKILAELEQAWGELDFIKILSLWDQNQAPIYFAEEAQAPLLDWEALRGYWSFTASVIKRMNMKITSIPSFHMLTADLVTVVYTMHWDAMINGDTRPMGGDNRVCATFRLTTEGWYFTQYIESPLAPIAYIRSLYEKATTPGFAD